MKRKIEMANTVFKIAGNGFIVYKSRFGDLKEGEEMNTDQVKAYLNKFEGIIIP